jgi:hypothetical protein
MMQMQAGTNPNQLQTPGSGYSPAGNISGFVAQMDKVCPCCGRCSCCGHVHPHVPNYGWNYPPVSYGAQTIAGLDGQIQINQNS